MEQVEAEANVSAWIKDLSTALGIDLELISGMCALSLGEDVLLSLEVSTEFPVLYLYSILCPFPQEEESVQLLLTRALELNAFQVHTRGGAIGSMPGGGALIYSLSLPVEGVDSDKFASILVEFRETVLKLRELLQMEPTAPNSKVQPKGLFV